MKDTDIIKWTEEGFKEFTEALTDFPEEQRETMAAMFAMMLS